MKQLMKKTMLIVAMIVVHHYAGGADIGVEPAVAGQPQEEVTESAGVVLERARILEHVDRDYGEALAVFRTLIDQEPEREILEKAELGAVNCLMKLGRYGEARTILDTMSQRGVSVAKVKTVGDLLAAIDRLSNRDRPESASSVDNLVWQLLDMGSGTDNDRACRAQEEIIQMGVLAVPILKEAALDRDYVRSVLAFKLLVNIGSEGVVDFVTACVQDPDLALRKRCLDGLTDGGRLHVDLVPSLITLFDDAEESLQAGALHCFRKYYRQIHGKLGAQINEVTARLLEFHKGGTERLREEAFETTAAIVNCLGRYPVENFPLDEIAAITGKALAENLPSGDRVDRASSYLRQAMSMAQVLGTRFGRVELLEQLSRFWLIDPARLDLSNSGRESLMSSAEHLPIGSFERIVTTLSETPDVAVRDQFAKLCPYTAFSRLPLETQKSFIENWARSAKSVTGGITDTIHRAIDRVPPALWAAFVASALENEDTEIVNTCLEGIGNCPDPSDPACVDALCLWAARSVDGSIQLPWKLIRGLIKAGTLNAGKKGALRVMESGLEAIEEPMRIWRYQGEHLTSSPRSAHQVLEILEDCVGFGSPAEVQQWILEQKRPGFHDFLLVDHPTNKTVQALLKGDHGFFLQIWPHLSRTGQEALFEIGWRIVSPSHRSSKSEWMVELLSRIESLEGWQTMNVVNVLNLLVKWYEPRLTDLTVEVVRIMFENPEPYAALPRVPQSLGNLLQTVASKSEKVMSLIPLWYKKFSSMGAGPAPQMYFAVKESRDKLRRALRWLVEDHGRSLKYNVLGGIIMLEPSLSRTYGLEEELRAIWPELDHDTRVLVIFNLVDKKSGVEATKDFLCFVLSDETTDLAVRHMVLPALLILGGESVVDPILAYLEKLDGGAGDGPMKVVCRDGLDPSRRNEDNFDYFFGQLRGSDSKETGARFGNFVSRDKQRICRGILTLPVLHPRLRSLASREMAINDDEDLEVMLAALQVGDCYYLFQHSVKYMLGKAQEDPERDRSSRALLRAKAESLLVSALNGDFEDRIERAGRLALDVIKDYCPASLLPHVGRMAVSHPDVNLRMRAVGCLAAYGTKETIPFLLDCLKDPETEYVSEPALQILERMRRHEEQRKAWEAMLGDSPEDGVSADPALALIEMLNHDDAEIRLAAIKSLGKLADPNTLPVLVQKMADGTPDERAAAKAAIDAITSE